MVVWLNQSIPPPKAVALVKTPKAHILAAVAPVVAPPAPVIPASYYTPNCQAYLPLVSQYNWPVQTAMAVMQAESNCRAITPSNADLNYDHVPDYGLFQLHGIDITDPAANVAYAYYHKYLPAGGFTPWSTYTSGAYRGYL